MEGAKKMSGMSVGILAATFIFLALITFKTLPCWYLLIFFITFALCMIGWEMWMSYGIIDGDSIEERTGRNNGSNMVLMCLGDAIIGVVQIWTAMKMVGPSAFKNWNWKAFGIIFAIGIVQNIIVTIALAKQIKGESISWAPLMPIKTDPIIQTQEPWILEPFILYAIAITIGSVEFHNK